MRARLAMFAVIAHSACLAIPSPASSTDGGASGDAHSPDGRVPNDDGGDGGIGSSTLQLVVADGCILPDMATINDGCPATIETSGYSLVFAGSDLRMPTQLVIGGANVLAGLGFEMTAASQSFPVTSIPDTSSGAIASLRVLANGPAAIELLVQGSGTATACNGTGAVATWSMSFTAYPDGRIVRFATLTPPQSTGCTASTNELINISGSGLEQPFDRVTLTDLSGTAVLAAGFVSSVQEGPGSGYSACITGSASEGPHVVIANRQSSDLSTNMAFTILDPLPSTFDAQLSHGFLDTSVPSSSTSTTFQADSRGSCADLTQAEIDMSEAGGAQPDATRGLYEVTSNSIDLSLFRPPVAVEIGVTPGQTIVVPQLSVGQYYTEVEQDPSKAIVWFAPSAGLGNVTLVAQ